MAKKAKRPVKRTSWTKSNLAEPAQILEGQIARYKDFKTDEADSGRVAPKRLVYSAFGLVTSVRSR